VSAKCKYCGLDADYVVQYGPQANNKEAACEDHVRKLLSSAKAQEMWIAKVQKI
tara:strand:+ start:276 stop:437 length:162 start_codon:yes stop_codon:yes gene_type:complete